MGARLGKAEEDVEEETMVKRGSNIPGKSLMNFGNKTLMVNKGTNRFSKHQKVRNQFQATINTNMKNSNYKNLVMCPVGEDRLEWLCLHAFIFYDIVENVFEICQDEHLCDDVNCPLMSAGKFTFLWADSYSEQYKTPRNVPASQYIYLALDWIFITITNEEVFPQEGDIIETKKGEKVLDRVYKLLFRIWAHLYLAHYVQIQRIGADAVFSSGFKHFITFIVRNQVLKLEQMEPLSTIITDVLRITLENKNG